MAYFKIVPACLLFIIVHRSVLFSKKIIFSRGVACLILKAQSHAMNTAKFGGKAFSVLLATVANLVTMNSGGKYALHFIGILMAGAVGFVRPLVSKA